MDTDGREFVCPSCVADVRGTVESTERRIATCESYLADGFDYEGTGPAALASMKQLRAALLEVYADDLV